MAPSPITHYCLLPPRQNLRHLLRRVLGCGVHAHLARQRVVDHRGHGEVHDLRRFGDDGERDAKLQHLRRDVQELRLRLAQLEPAVLEAITVAGVRVPRALSDLRPRRGV